MARARTTPTVTPMMTPIWSSVVGGGEGEAVVGGGEGEGGGAGQVETEPKTPVRVVAQEQIVPS